MKSKLLTSMLIIFSLLIFLSENVNAPPVPPYVIAGQVSLEDGSCVSGFNIKAKTFSFSEFQYKEIDVAVNEDCEYALVLGNAPFDNWNEGMKVDLTFCDVSKNSLCLKSIIIGQGGCEAGGGCRLDFKYKTTDYTPTGEPIVKYIEKEVIKEVQKIVCQDGTVVSDINECLETKEQIDNYLYGAGAIAVVYGFWRLIRYYSRKGKKARAKKMADTYKAKRRR